MYDLRHPGQSRFRRRAVFGALAGCLALSGCGGDQPPPDFAPPDYSYLAKMRLSVSGLTVEDHSAQSMGPNDLAPTSPVPPDQALQQMARDRLVAAGNTGSAVFTIDQASITGSPGAALDGHMAVHLDIIAANGAHAGYAEAHVSHQFIPGSDSAGQGGRAALYGLTQQMMQDMNVELEYQVKRSLRDWLVDASGAPVANTVEQQSLPPPTGSSSAGSPGSVGTPVGTTPLGTTSLGTTPLATPPVTSPPPATPPVPSPPPATNQAAQSTPDAVFPDGTPTDTDPAPTTVQAPPPQPPPLQSPPPHYLQPPAGGNR